MRDPPRAQPITEEGIVRQPELLGAPDDPDDDDDDPAGQSVYGRAGRDRAKIWAGIALIALPQVIPHGLSQRTRKGEREDEEEPEIAAQHDEETQL